MRWLIWVILGVATLWGGLWFAASSMVERGVQDWFKGQGPAASATRIEVAGFPSRIDLTLTEPRFICGISLLQGAFSALDCWCAGSYF